MYILNTDLKKILKEKGFKITTQRQAMLEVLEQNEGKHLSAEEIFDFIKVNYPDIGIATVYRTLLLFVEMEVCCKHDFDDGLSRYELNHSNEFHKHHHLICTVCGDITEVQEDLLESLEEQILLKNNFVVKDHKVKFYGICGKCKINC